MRNRDLPLPAYPRSSRGRSRSEEYSESAVNLTEVACKVNKTATTRAYLPACLRYNSLVSLSRAFARSRDIAVTVNGGSKVTPVAPVMEHACYRARAHTHVSNPLGRRARGK